MNKIYRILVEIALVLLFTGAILAASCNLATSSNVERNIIDQNSTVIPSPVLSYTPTSINTTKVGESEMTDGIWLAIFSAIGSAILGIIGMVMFDRYKRQKAEKIEDEKRQRDKKTKDEKRLEARNSFVESSIIKIKNEFEPVTICRANNYDFELKGYTVSLKTGESLIIPQPLPDEFKYLMIAGWGFAKKDGKPMGNMKSGEELGIFSFLKDDQDVAGDPIPIVQPTWKCKQSIINCEECIKRSINEGAGLRCIKILDANPDPAYGSDPSIEEIREKGIVGKVKSRYTNIHTHWIDLNIYIYLLKIPEDAKHIKISLAKPNRTHISLNIAEIIPITDKKEYDVIRKALEEEIQHETIKNDENVKTLLELYRGLRNKEKPTDDDKGKLWSSADGYIEKKDIYVASKLIKYALILENDLNDRKKKILGTLMSTLNEKVENNSDKEDAAQACVLLSHFYGLKAKFDRQHKEELKNEEAENIAKAGDMIEKIFKENKEKYVDELMNLQWRCYESATMKYDKMSDVATNKDDKMSDVATNKDDKMFYLQKAMEIRVKLNEVFERITERHPFASPIIDNVFENFNETTNLTEKRWNISLRDKDR